MKNQNEKVESSKQSRFSVIVEKVEVLNTSDQKEADSKIAELQVDLKPLIILIDSNKKTSVQYSKKLHQKNYRMEAGNFEADSLIRPTAKAIEAQE